MSDNNNRPSLLGPAMISASILALAGAVFYDARPRVFETLPGGNGSTIMDDGSRWTFEVKEGVDGERDRMTPVRIYLPIR